MTTARIIGWVMTLGGCPYIFTTPGVAAATSSNPLWFGGETGVQVADGWLHWPDIQIEERARPLDGDVDVDPIRVKLHDAPIDSGPAAGYNLLSFLATRDLGDIPSSLLASTVSATATTWTVGDGTVFSADTFAWIEQECVRVTAVSGNDLTVVRGRLGTRAVRHAIAEDEGIQPEVFTSLPWATRRKAVLWAVLSDLTASPVWLGTAGAAPDLSSDGVSFELPCDPLWNTLKEATVGAARGVVELTGFSGGSYGGIGGGFRVGNATYSGVTCDRRRWVSFDAAAQSFVDRAVVVLNTPGFFSNITTGSARGFFRRDGQRGVFNFDFDTTSTVTVGNVMSVPPGPSTPLASVNLSGDPIDRGSDRRGIMFTMDYCPQVAYALRMDGTDNTLGIRSMSAFDNFYQPTPTAPVGRAFTVDRVLKTTLNDDWNVLFTGVNSFAASRYFTAKTVLQPRKVGLPAAPPGSVWLVDPPPLSVATRVQVEHWADGWRYGMLSQIDQGMDADWDWTAYERLIWTTRGPQAARSWVIDGTRTAGELLREACLLNGCSVGVRAGRLSLVPWQLPRADATPAATFTSDDLLGPITPWEVWKEGFANRVTLKSPLLTVTIQDDRSTRRYGVGRDIQVDMEGVEVDRLRSLQPGELYRQLLSRLSLWADPLGVVALPVSLTRMFDAYIGDTIQVTEWNAPDGLGGRGLSADRGLVLGRRLDIQTGIMTLQTLLFKRRAYGYAPCVKAAGVEDAITISLDATPVRGAEDYAGSVSAGLSDAGSSKFTAGDVVRCILRDSTTAFSEVLTVDSTLFDGTNWIMVFTTSMSATLQGHITGGGWVDVVLDTYTGASTAARNWAWVASETTGVIDGTAAPAHRIAP
jgi:hypothetical protein